jgi:hypothetical protein
MKKILTLALMLAAAPLAASAGELSYTYVEGGFERNSLDIDVIDADFDGYAVRGSVAFGEAPFYAFGGYSATTNDDFGLNVDLNQSNLGLGFHHSVADKADFVAELSYVNVEAKIGSNSADAHANRASDGFRGELAVHFEGNIKVNYTDGDGGSEFAPSFGVQFKFNQTWGVVADAEVGSENTRYLVGVRASF